MPFFFLNHSHLHITAFIHKKNPFKKGCIAHTGRRHANPAWWAVSVHVAPISGLCKPYCFNGLISCVRVDSQWEISALGGAAITWPPPFIKYLPAHSQGCTLFRIAPMITFPAFAVQCATLTPVFVSISLLFHIIYPCSVLATPPTTPVKNIFVTEEVRPPFHPLTLSLKRDILALILRRCPPRCACF